MRGQILTLTMVALCLSGWDAEAGFPQPDFEMTGYFAATASGRALYCVETDGPHHGTPTRSAVLLTLSPDKKGGILVDSKQLGEVWLLKKLFETKIDPNGPEPSEERAQVRAQLKRLKRAKLDTRNIQKLGKKHGFDLAGEDSKHMIVRSPDKRSSLTIDRTQVEQR